MGLELSTVSYKGRLVAVKPVYGWGWYRLDAPGTPVPAEVNGAPRPFHCRIQYFCHFNGELNGAVAVIEEPDHIYDRLWAYFWLRVTGMYNFVDRLPHCNIEIGPDAPVGERLEFVSGSPRVGGYCWVGETLKHLEANVASMAAKR